MHNVVLFAMSGIDMAAWDALGQAHGEPLVRLLGGAPRPVRAYNSKGLGIMPLKALVREAIELVSEGFGAVKLRLGRPEARDDIEALRAVKKALGTKVTLMVDFNQGLTVSEALRRGRMIDEEGGVLLDRGAGAGGRFRRQRAPRARAGDADPDRRELHGPGADGAGARARAPATSSCPTRRGSAA